MNFFLWSGTKLAFKALGSVISVWTTWLSNHVHYWPVALVKWNSIHLFEHSEVFSVQLLISGFDQEPESTQTPPWIHPSLSLAGFLRQLRSTQEKSNLPCCMCRCDAGIFSLPSGGTRCWLYASSKGRIRFSPFTSAPQEASSTEHVFTALFLTWDRSSWEHSWSGYAILGLLCKYTAAVLLLEQTDALKRDLRRFLWDVYK